MNAGDALSYCRRFAPIVRDRLGLWEWDITIRFRTLEGVGDGQSVRIGTCEVNPRYRTAVIVIDPDSHPDHDALCATLLHEHCHIAHGFFDLYRKQAEATMPSGTVESIAASYSMAAEACVRVIEMAVTRGAGLTPREFVEGVKCSTGPNPERYEAAVAYRGECYRETGDALIGQYFDHTPKGVPAPSRQKEAKGDQRGKRSKKRTRKASNRGVRRDRRPDRRV